jgi:hypothetical protein
MGTKAVGRPREPKYKLSTMRIMWGVLSGITLLNAFLQFGLGHTILPIFQLILVVLTGWYAISPPAYIRKKFIQ